MFRAASPNMVRVGRFSVNWSNKSGKTIRNYLTSALQRWVLVMKISCILISLGQRQHLGFTVKLTQEG